MPAFVHDFQYMILLLIVMLLFNHNDCSNISCDVLGSFLK